MLIFELLFERREPGVRDRGERDDRDGVRGDRKRHERGAEDAPTREEQRDQDREAEPSTNRPSASWNVNHARAPELVPSVSQNVGAIADGFGSRNSCT